MNEQIIYLTIGIGITLGAIFLWRFIQKRKQTENKDTMQENMINMQKFFAEQFDRSNAQMDRRLKENVQAMNESKNFLAGRVSEAERSVRSVAMGLGKLDQATSSLQKTSDEIASFQHMLKSPKVRGSFGEVLLGNLLADVMPQDRYELQYTYKSGDIADAIIRMQDNHIVAVDAKFPLANYEAFINEEDQDIKKQKRKAFTRDVKKHIQDISKKYIAPEENTLDFAFMYIPIEGVFYETIMHDQKNENLGQFAMSKKVFPVSPNSFLAYLQTVLIGLRGMKIEEQAREILTHIGQLRTDFGKFSEDFSTVGTHLSNAKNRFDDSSRRLDKFTNRLDQIETGTEAPKLEEKAEEKTPVV